jgi:predicted phosphodiesterase
MTENIHGWRVLVIPDTHVPFEDKRAYELMLNVAKSLRGLKEIVLLGDYADFFHVTAHKKSLYVGLDFKEERHLVCSRLRELQTIFPEVKKTFICGNHEQRLESYLRDKAPELFGIIDIPEFLALDLYGFDYVPYGPFQRYEITEGLYARHEPIAGGVNHARGTVSKAVDSVIYGHTHSVQEAHIVSLSGELMFGISSGWLGDKHHPVFSYLKGHAQWALSFTIIDVLSNGVWFHHSVNIKIKGDRYFCTHDGYYYEN